MTRRDFLVASVVSLPMASTAVTGKQFSADVAVIGGGVGGCAAALAACRTGMKVIMTEPTDWIGGQLTSQAVPPDEHPWIEKFGCTASYRRFRDGVRRFYKENFPLAPEAAAKANFNPGDGWVSRLCCEPRVALAVLRSMLAPFVADGRLKILLRSRPVKAAVDRDLVRAVELLNEGTGDRQTLWARYFVDATELGELLPLTQTEHVVGAESSTATHESSASVLASPLDQQALTWCFTLEYFPGEDHTIDRPDEYAFWSDYIPKMTPPWTGKLLSWECSHPVTLRPRGLMFDPAGTGSNNLWTYRRVRAAHHFQDPSRYRDLVVANWPQNDYWLGPIVGVPEEDAAKHLRRARQLSLSLVYWMQTAAPRSDGGTGWKGLRLASDAVEGPDGLAKAPYIRESRRILAEFTVTEAHVSAAARKSEVTDSSIPVRAETFSDSVGIGAYRLDLHPSTAGRNYIDRESLPFQIPMGALIPRRVENLLAGAKNIGTTHITNGCYRLHPVEWNIGEAAGALAAHCVQRSVRPRQVRKDPERRMEFQAELRRAGFELEWPAEVHSL